MAFNKVVTAKSTQTVFDLALQLHGSVDEVFTLLEENPVVESVEDDVSGEEISYTINNNYVQKSYLSRGTIVASKPKRYRNTILPKLKIGEDSYLLINGTYNLLI